MQTVIEADKLVKVDTIRIQCDGCSARAVFLVNLPFGDLYFCYHHYNKNSNALTDQGGVATLL